MSDAKHKFTFFLVYILKAFFWLPSLAFTILWASSADDKLMILFSFFPGEHRIWHFMQIVSFGHNLLEMSESPLDTICSKCQNLFFSFLEK